MKKFFILLAIVTVAYCYRGFIFSPTQEKNENIATAAASTYAAITTAVPEETVVEAPAEKTVCEPKQQQVLSKSDIVSPTTELEDEILICVAYTEKFRPKAYTCCGQWLIGYGQARINGKLVHAGQTIDELTAQQQVVKHLRNHVFPVVNSSVTRPLTRGEFITCCLYAYNCGTGAFKKSSFLKAVNAGVSPEECVKHLKGKGGVGKRRWVDAALFTGAINPYDLLQLSAGGCYNFSTKDLYTSDGVVDLSPEKVDEFLTSPLNQRGESLRSII